MVPYGGLAVDMAGDLFIADNSDPYSLNIFRVRKVGPDGIITTVAGTGKAGFSGDGGPAIGAMLDHAFALAVDSAGTLFIGDWGNYRVQKVDATTGTITTVAGIGKKPYAGDGGPATQTGLRGPLALDIDPAGNLFIADSGTAGYHGTDGLPGSERFLKVFGVAAPDLLAVKAFPQ